MSSRGSNSQESPREADGYRNRHSITVRNPNYSIPPIPPPSDSYYDPYSNHSYYNHSYSPIRTFYQISHMMVIDGHERQYLSTSPQLYSHLHSAPRQPSSYYPRGNYLPEEMVYSYPVRQLSERYRYDNVQYNEDRNPERRWFRPVSTQKITNQISRQVDQRAPSFSYGIIPL